LHEKKFYGVSSAGVRKQSRKAMDQILPVEAAFTDFAK
jgi:hypothetical protein